MSWDITINRAACPTCGHGQPDPQQADDINLTFNLSKMLKTAGFIGWHTLDGMNARAAGQHITAILAAMRLESSRWRSMNPENGWGDYDKCIQTRLRTWGERCLAAGPDDTISCNG